MSLGRANYACATSAPHPLLPTRSAHHVTSQTHAQFAPLDAWIDTHRADLCALLGDAPHRRILFGEWVRAKHSIAYSRLPDCTCF